jgi:hypothetical protein
MEFRLPFSSAKPPFYVSVNDQRELNTWEGPYGTHDVDFNWGSEWGNVVLAPTDNKDAMNAVEVLYLKNIPKRNIPSEESVSGQLWLTNSRVQIQPRRSDYGSLDPDFNNKIELGIRDCDIKHRPWDGLTIEVTGYITYQVTYPYELFIYDVVFEIVLAKADFQTTPVMAEIDRPYGLGYDPDYKVFWFLIDGPEVPSGAVWSYYTIQDIVSVTPASAFEPPTPA